MVRRLAAMSFSASVDCQPLYGVSQLNPAVHTKSLYYIYCIKLRFIACLGPIYQLVNNLGTAWILLADL